MLIQSANRHLPKLCADYDFKLFCEDLNAVSLEDISYSFISVNEAWASFRLSSTVY